MRHPPVVSVVMTVYNGAPHLAAAIESILRQSFADFEFLIADDGSSDRSADLIREYAARDPRIRPLFGGHRGHGAAANAAIALAQGELIARMDHDDIALPERLSIQLTWMKRTGADICGGQVRTFGSEEKTWWFPETHAAIANELLFRASLMQPATTLRASILRANPYHEHAIFDDYELWTRLAARCVMANVPEVVLHYRRHAGQTHVLKSRELSADFRRYRFRYFYEVHPGCPLADYLALARISDRLPATSLPELERAGRWLVELAQPAEPRLRSSMAERWRETCERAVGLGPGVSRVLESFQQQFDKLAGGALSR